MNNFIKADLKSKYKCKGAYYDYLRLLKWLFFNMNFRALFLNRIYNSSKSKFFKRIIKFYSHIIAGHYGIDIPVSCKLGKGIFFPHQGPIIINPSSVIGDNVIIHPCVLIGGMRGKGSPKIGNNVFIGNGAKLIGNITIGDNVFISPNTVVVKDVADNACCGGCPAKVLNYKGKEYVSLYL